MNEMLCLFIPYIYGDEWVEFGSVCASLDEAKRELKEMIERHKEEMEDDKAYCCSDIHPIKLNIGTY